MQSTRERRTALVRDQTSQDGDFFPFGRQSFDQLDHANARAGIEPDFRTVLNPRIMGDLICHGSRFGTVIAMLDNAICH